MRDPRPDLGDSERWEELLALLEVDKDDPRGLYGRIRGFRASGCVLKWRGDAWMLAPVLDTTGTVSVWPNWASWDQDVRSWLVPYSARI